MIRLAAALCRLAAWIAAFLVVVAVLGAAAGHALAR